jgi:chromosome segregation ATPase
VQLGVEELFGFVERYGLLAVIVIVALVVFLAAAPVLVFAQRLRIQANAKVVEAQAKDVETEANTRLRMNDIALAALREKSDGEIRLAELQEKLMSISLQFAERRAMYDERERYYQETLKERDARYEALDKQRMDSEVLLNDTREQLKQVEFALKDAQSEVNLSRELREKDKEMAAQAVEAAKSTVQMLTEENRLLREQNTMLKERLDDIQVQLNRAQERIEEISSQHQTISTEMVSLAEDIHQDKQEIENEQRENAAGGGDAAVLVLVGGSVPGAGAG